MPGWCRSWWRAAAPGRNDRSRVEPAKPRSIMSREGEASISATCSPAGGQVERVAGGQTSRPCPSRSGAGKRRRREPDAAQPAAGHRTLVPPRQARGGAGFRPRNVPASDEQVPGRTRAAAEHGPGFRGQLRSVASPTSRHGGVQPGATAASAVAKHDERSRAAREVERRARPTRTDRPCGMRPSRALRIVIQQ